MTSSLTLVLLIAASTGFGAMVLRAIGVLGDLALRERLTWSFAVGYGTLGWLLFILGVAALYKPLPMILLMGVGALGLLAFRKIPAPVYDNTMEDKRWGFVDLMLLAALAIALVYDFMEGLAPPADADSMAYHFALAKQFLGEGQLIFVERAMDGAIPLLNQMTYIPALGLGGEKGLTLWTMVSGWGATALLFSICRRYLDRRWSLSVSIIFLTTPAVVYGGGSGQVEIRNAMFATIAAFSIARAVTIDDLRYAVLAGLAVGFFMAGKYTGLLFALGCGLSILLQRRWFVHGFVLTAIALVAGGQWYAWNMIHTGDPFFPVLFGVLDNSTLPFWSPEQNATLQKLLLHSEQAVSTNVLWLALYPFVATFSGYPQFESGRTGLGPYILLILPFALAGLWRFRARIRRHPLFIAALVAVLFYALWFLIGSSQRARHMVPVLPIVLLVFTVSAHRWCCSKKGTRPLIAAVFISVGLQLAGHSVFSLNYAQHHMSGETRDAFLRRNVHSYDVVPWVNDNLGANDRLFIFTRQLNFLLDVPYFYAHIQQEGWIDLRPEANDPLRFLRQVRERGITHLLVIGDPLEKAYTGGIMQWRPLLHAGCLEIIRKIDTRLIGSRTLGQAHPGQAYILNVSDFKCVL